MEHALTASFGTPGDPSIRYDGKTDKQIVRESMRHAGFSDDDVNARIDDVIALYVANLPARLADPERGVKMYPGVAALIAQPGTRIAGFVFIGTPGKALEERPRPDYDAVVRYW